VGGRRPRLPLNYVILVRYLNIDRLKQGETAMDDKGGKKEWVARDGAVDIKIFSSERIKILWVLREPNGRDFDFMEYLQDPTVYNKWKATYGLVVKVSHAILTGLSVNEKSYPYPSDIPKIMSRIALINIKKTGGYSRANYKELKEYLLTHSDEFISQISELSPDLIIFAGTLCFVPKEIIKTIHNNSREKTHIIDAYHPNQTTITHNKYINGILEKIELENPQFVHRSGGS